MIAKKTAVAPYIMALRPHQWTKNLVVFAAALFSFHLDGQALLSSLFAFALFCGISSSFYLFNDITDVESDRRHPVKCKRPIASGAVSVPAATIMAIALFGGTVVLGLLHSMPLGATLLAYAALQFAYNKRLKRAPILDIFAIAGGFILRAWAGAAAIGITLSPWFLLGVAMLALFLGVEKRKAELRWYELQGGKKTRAVLKRYSMELLLRLENTVTTGAIMSYALWSSGPQVKGAPTPWMMVTLPFVLYGIFRYQLLSDPKEICWRAGTDKLESHIRTERPEDILLSDFPMQLTLIGWVTTIILILSLQNQGIVQ
ncbi:decaprenyl-phosphate phosphoribosyltransferase [Geitlerinema sp. PCC 9228]|uniref:decaprenyl-phosphate phosphoribosyltransferase n=1 Tax=Geitlerinema sp. PCC 9228 TaxID=111611 RepID=UPI0008F9B5FA|nr:decaprenyl-phosphate phosphoribosyltransferase [Geitlerinema sp. PCC 9228]